MQPVSVVVLNWGSVLPGSLNGKEAISPRRAMAREYGFAPDCHHLEASLTHRARRELDR